MIIYGCGICHKRKKYKKNLAEKSFGDVLVVGYGLGVVSHYCLKNKNVRSVTTVEKYQEVIDKLSEIDKIYGDIIINDFFDLSEDKKYDCIIGDIWAEIDKEFLNDYVKFKEKAKKLLRKNGIMLAWGQDYFEYLLSKR